MNNLRLVRTKDAASHLGMPVSTLYFRRKNGLVVPPVSTGGPKTVAYPLNELDCINSARIQGASDEEIRELVKRLVVARAKAAA